MNTTLVADALRDGLMVTAKLAGPILIGCMLIGLLIAIFQAVTQIHEQTIGFILKLVAVILVLLIGGGWMLETLQDYAREMFQLIAA